jgi:transcriptional regulator with XRE-family HTH domain
MTEAEKARTWRKAQGLTIKQLSELTGFAMRSITAYEGGKQSSGDPIPDDAMRRYRLACAAVHHGHHKRFDWDA